ncbi:hypothetical protein [Corticicoccus populi]|uniref:Uncharacterized protein n=1 Tax=Corticicoccus populi TaxID=1812821 RepID=A0ABW5WW12_9STAP
MEIYMNINSMEKFAKENNMQISYERIVEGEYLNVMLQHDINDMFVGINFHKTEFKISIFENNQWIDKDITASSQEDLTKRIKMYLDDVKEYDTLPYS